MHDILPRIVRANTSNVELLVKAAEEDNHTVWAPTHIVLKDQEIIGSLSIGNIPNVLVWMHTQKAKSRDSLFVQAFYEEVVNHQMLPKGGIFYLPTSSKSPYCDYLPKVGYQKTQTDLVFVKQLSSIL